MTADGVSTSSPVNCGRPVMFTWQYSVFCSHTSTLDSQRVKNGMTVIYIYTNNIFGGIGFFCWCIYTFVSLLNFSLLLRC